jgi:alkanesulfonate monooxygenase SsuD/methylene tetrahydromethanopterin reductase-like flavin-dependent oxidoreductase (luciferase family)
MKLGFFTMPIHPVDKDWRLSLKEDREAFVLADELGFTEAYVGEHVTDKAENITSCIAFIAWLAAATRQIKLGTGTVNMPNAHPAAVAASIAMLDHMLDGRLIFGISPGGLLSDAEVLAISKPTGMPCSWRRSIRYFRSGPASRPIICKVNSGAYRFRKP